MIVFLPQKSRVHMPRRPNYLLKVCMSLLDIQYMFWVCSLFTGQSMQKKLSESRIKILFNANVIASLLCMAGLNPIFPEPHDVHKAVPGTVLYLPDAHDKHVLLLGVNPALHEQLLTEIEPIADLEFNVQLVHVTPELSCVEYFEASHKTHCVNAELAVAGVVAPGGHARHTLFVSEFL